MENGLKRDVNANEKGRERKEYLGLGWFTAFERERERKEQRTSEKESNFIYGMEMN